MFVFFLDSSDASAQITPVTQIYSSYNGWWSSGVGALNAKNTDNSSLLLAFKSNGTVYSTGINNALLDQKLGSGNYNSVAEYQALPIAKIAVDNNNSYIGIGYNWNGIIQDGGGTKTGYAKLTNSPGYYLTDGINGLELGTVVFNAKSGTNSTFPINTINPAEIGKSTTPSDIVITQMGDPGATTDIFKFTDASGNTVGNQVSVVLNSLPVLGSSNWTLFNAATLAYSTSAGVAPQSRDIRMGTFDLEDFGLTAGNIGQVTQFVHIPGGTSDMAFVGAYNKNAFSFVMADLSIEKSVDKTLPVNAGDDVKFTIKVTNNGPSDASSVIVNDLLPTGYTYQASSTTNYNSATGVWSIGNLPNGSVATLTVTAKVKSTGLYENIAAVSAYQSDPVMLNNKAMASVTLANRSIALTKSGTYEDTNANGNVDIGDYINYSFVVKNTGNVTITNITVDDTKLGVYGLLVSSSLAAGATSSSVTRKYALTQADIDAGNVINSAAATGKDSSTNDIKDTSGSAIDNDTPTTIYLLVAKDDDYSSVLVDKISGNANVGNILDNDLWQAAAPTVGNVSIGIVTPATPAYSGANVPSVDTSTGIVSVPATTPAGKYTIVYQLCDKTTTTLCDKASITVVVRPKPPVVTDVTVCCDGAPHTASATAGVGETVIWYDAATGGNIINAFTAPGAYTVYAASKDNASGYESTRTAAVLTINATPALTLDPASQTICSGATATLAALGTNPGTVVTWSSDYLGITGTGTSITSNALANKGTASLVAHITAVADNGNCTATATATVTVKPEPRIIVEPGFLEVCASEAPHVALTSVLPGTTINWQLVKTADNSVVSSGNGTDSVNLFSNPLPAGDYTLKVTGSKDGCTGSEIKVSLVVN